jgi:hypothetical protein
VELIALLALLAAAAPPAADLELRASPVPLDPLDPTRARLGQLEFRGGLELVSPDPRFGGWSGLAVTPDGTELRAISDQGHWLEARIRHDPEGRLAGLDDVRTGPLLGVAGLPLAGKRDADAESLALLPGGALLVGFEHRSRILEYAGGLAARPRSVPGPAELDELPDNGGLETLLALRDGRLLALSEALAEGPFRVGWLREAEQWSRILYEPALDFDPTDADQLASGELVVLERAYSVIRGPRCRLVRVPADQVRPGATLRGELLAELSRPLAVDNFEGLSAVPGAAGRTLLYLLSDDNYDRHGQRTLLLLFELDGADER